MSEQFRLDLLLKTNPCFEHVYWEYFDSFGDTTAHTLKSRFVGEIDQAVPYCKPENLQRMSRNEISAIKFSVCPCRNL
jgi:hypothetical protein